MMVRALSLFGTIGVVGAVVGLPVVDDRAERASNPPTAIIKIQSDAVAQSLLAKVGEPVSVSFEIQGGAGHKWWPEEPLPAFVKLIDMSFDQIDVGKVGGATRQTLIFRVETANRYDIVLVFRRSWEPLNDSAPRMVIRIIATE
jgi:hypothetical protein